MSVHLDDFAWRIPLHFMPSFAQFSSVHLFHTIYKAITWEKIQALHLGRHRIIRFDF